MKSKLKTRIISFPFSSPRFPITSVAISQNIYPFSFSLFRPREERDHLILTFEKNFIEFHREFYFWERFEKRVFPTDPLSRTDTFGTHCTYISNHNLGGQFAIVAKGQNETHERNCDGS
jgi:hypothetical protein